MMLRGVCPVILDMDMSCDRQYLSCSSVQRSLLTVLHLTPSFDALDCTEHSDLPSTRAQAVAPLVGYSLRMTSSSSGL